MTEKVRDRETGIDKYKNGERDNLPDQLEMHNGRVHAGGVGSGPVLVQVHAQHVGLQFRLILKQGYILEKIEVVGLQAEAGGNEA